MDSVIIGAGLIGMMTAWELVQAGQSVAVVDKNRIGQESSWAGGGILSPLYPWRYPQPVQRLAIWSQKMYPDLVASWYGESGIDPQWQQSGLLILDTDELDNALSWASLYGYQLEHVHTEQIDALAPGLKHQGEAIWLPDIGQVRNPRLIKALHASLQAAGVTFYEQTRVESFVQEENEILGVNVKNDTGQSMTISAEHTIVAGGAWTAGLLKQLEIVLPIEPVKGQMLMFKAQPGLLSRIVLHQDRYLIPRKDGHILVGSTLEKTGFDKAISEAAHADLYYTAIDMLPALEGAPVEKQWAGLRPGSPQGIPFIYKPADYSGLYINAGQYRNGVVLAPASAHFLADIILDRPPIADIESYQPVVAGEMLAT